MFDNSDKSDKINDNPFYTSTMKIVSHLETSNNVTTLEKSYSGTATASGNSLNEILSNSLTTLYNLNNDVTKKLSVNNIVNQEMNIKLILYQVPIFETIISDVKLLPCMIFDNNNNLYLSSDGHPNQLLKYDLNYTKRPFVSDSAWLNEDGSYTSPVAMAFNKDFTYMYVINFTGNSITVIDMTPINDEYKYRTLILIPDGTHTNHEVGYRLKAPNGLTFDSTYSYMIATNIVDSNLVKIVINNSDPYTGTISPFNINITLRRPVLIANDDELPENNFYVSDLTESIVYKVNSTSYSEVIRYPIIFGPRGVSFNPKNYNKLWITNSTDIPTSTTDYPVVSVNLTTKSIEYVLNSPLFNIPRGVLFDKDNYMYISNFGTVNSAGSILKSKEPVYL